MISGFLSSIYNSVKALQYLFKPWVIKYLVFSGLISTFIYAAFIYSIFKFGDDLGQLLISKFVTENTWQWLVTTIEWLTRIILTVGFVFIFKYIVLIITSPFMSALSEDLENRLTGKEKMKQTIGFQVKSMVRGLRLSVGNLFKELGITLLFLLIGLIPVIGLVSSVLIFAVQAYFAGFGNLDFFMERRFNIRESTRFVKLNKGVAIGNGSVFLLLFLVPVLGAFFAPTICTITGTLSALERT
ncbi:EI24 domain-containing protein [Saprospiraceae bacterium]|nr:EI24 domain-containing protein [Saprospiraceae bacterium]